MRVGVTGASGFIGAALCNAFVNAGWDVVGFTRPALDLAGAVSPRQFAGIDVLVHAAYDTRDRDGINVEGTRRVFDAARRAGVRTRVFISSVSASAGAASVYGRTKYACEALLDPSTDLIIRPGLVIGDGGLFRTMHRTLSRYHVAPLIDGGKQPVYGIGIQDLCEIITALIQRNAHGTFTVANPAPVEMRSLYAAIASRIPGPVFFVPLPLRALQVAVTLFERLGLKPPLDSERLRSLRNLQPLSSVPSEICGIRPRRVHDVLQAVCIS